MNRLKFGMVLCAAVVLSTACGGGFGTLGGTGTGGLSGGGVGDLAGGGQTSCTGDFGTTEAAGKLEAFLSATTKFTSTADELQNSLRDSCRQMGAELGIPESEMAASGGTPEAKAACDAVAAKLRSELSDLRGSARLRIAIVATPPVCEVRIDAYAQCAGSCDASFTPGSAEIHCEGGEIRGGCSAQCTGSCSVTASGSCSGSCEGTCSASCTGVCQGNCEGTCRTRAADGSCNGACQGTCQGTCSAGCTGSCQGQCVAQAQASCSGECRGGCSVQMTEPRCTGTITPPAVSAECQASCDASLNAEAECTPGSVEVTVTGRVATNLEERVNHLKAAIRIGLGNILAAKLKLERLARSADAIGRTARDLPGAVATLGLGAASCVTSAAAALPRATASISVSVEVSASVSGSVGG
jgi:hypothetical protein